jgi:hypothetical protein
MAAGAQDLRLELFWQMGEYVAHGASIGLDGGVDDASSVCPYTQRRKNDRLTSYGQYLIITTTALMQYSFVSHESCSRVVLAFGTRG